MVNGNYVLYGDRPSSESEIVDDHVQTRTAERKNKRKPTRTANELQRTLNMAQLDNETDSIKYEKKAKEPRLLRYVPTTDVEENFVTEKFETYDLKPTEERPRRYAFQKKTKNPADGSVNYAYSRSSSSCSSPNGNLPTISEHGEQYGTYRAQPLPSPRDGDIINQYEHKLDKYFYKPKEVKNFVSKVNYEGSHPDSLYRVQPSSSSGVDKMVKVLRVLRWPVALVAICIALAVFVYFLMPDNTEPFEDVVMNQTFWNPPDTPVQEPAYHHTEPKKHIPVKITINGAKTPEIDFYNSESDKNVEITSVIDTMTDSAHRVLPIKPVFPSHITPEVQYGNERADADKLRTPKVLEISTLSDDSTLKPHITQKPEKPLAVYFKENTITTTETISRAETVNEFANYGDKQTTKKVEVSTKSDPTPFKDHRVPILKLRPLNIKQYFVTEPEIPPEVQEFYGPPSANIDANFTSGHSKLFGISIEDAEKMKSTTQSSLYNTRVSPTLPTWRDGDDTTTKHYPANVNNEAPLCRSTRFQLCREILPYDLAGFPVKIAGVEISAFVPHIEYLAHTNCSDRVKHFMCALLEPECNPRPYPPKMPCFSLCRAIVDACDGVIPSQLAEAFDCKRYSETDCIAAKAPCFDRELACGDGNCIPREWVCDNTKDCPGGEDEASCSSCGPNEYRCSSGGCILNRWLCDGYTDCPGGEDETEACDRHVAGEPGEESAGSAPAPAVRRPNKIPKSRSGDLHRAGGTVNNVAFGEMDNSKELLVTSDSSNSFKRNFTRRPPLSRLTPYTRSTTPPPNEMPVVRKYEPGQRIVPTSKEDIEPTEKPSANRDSMEDVNIGDLGIFEDINKTTKIEKEQPSKSSRNFPVKSKPGPARAVLQPDSSLKPPTRLDKSINKLEKVINGAALMQKAQAVEDQEVAVDSPEVNNTTFEKADDIPMVHRPGAGSKSAHASPCPSGELRCVDGRCITLAQLCDGTIDCTDHADEDNCYT